MSAIAGRTARPNGWYGMLILVAAETALFGTLIATYVYLRFRTPSWPPDGISPPSAALPIVLALALLATSAPMALAARAVREGRVRAALAALAPVYLLNL
jgi:heme/copper-type cytochrome/quinol oxidase subunit 3